MAFYGIRATWLGQWHTVYCLNKFVFPPTLLLLMKKLPFPFVVSAVGLVTATVVFVIWGTPYFFQPSSIVQDQNAFGSQMIRARVTKILEEGQITLGENQQPYQVLDVELLEGDYKGLLMEVDYGKRQLRNDTNRLV